MARRRRSQSNQNNIIILVIAGLIALFSLGSKFFSDNNSENLCGNREEDEKRSGYCLVDEDDFDSLAIVVGNTQNTPLPNLDFTSGELYDILSGIFYSDDLDINIVSVAGTNPDIVFNTSRKAAKNLRASNNNLKNLAEELSQALQTPATSSGANYLDAIIYAARKTSDAEHPLIIVVGSGYSDSGSLNFAQDSILNLYNKNRNIASDILSDNSHLDRTILKNSTIYWYNIGEVVAPQPDLRRYSNDTSQIYEDALIYLGANPNNIKFKPPTGLTDDAKSANSQYSVQQVYVDELKAGDMFNVNENIGRFEPDRSMLINRKDVESKLTPFATKFNVKSNLKLKITGYVAFCLADNQLGLSRANTIRDILVSLGIPHSSIETYGERGSPPEHDSEAYTCNSSLPETERRTVKIEVVKK